MSPIFLTAVRTHAGKAAARLLVDSIRDFGGPLAGSPIWLFAVDPKTEPCRDLAAPQVEVIPISVPEAIARYPFGAKVLACARAEALAPAGVGSLIWLDPDCLVVGPPVLFDLGDEIDAALRPVHVRNVGLPPSVPLDAFWGGICAALGVEEIRTTVESFVDRRRLRAYFNSHGLAVNPARGLFRRWHEHFERLVRDEAFQAAACPDELHRIFLFQALFSALAAASLPPRRLRILPSTYNYPYNCTPACPRIGAPPRSTTSSASPSRGAPCAPAP